ncbi:MAG: orotidine-5'-phosphate decarboxylase [Deltaproteobacteria bacterium]|nr:MAG: orotidine-5'-phosphate decarboxylase [Deltaproteobacteria bacterium]
MKEPKDFIIFPLDLPDYDQAIRYAGILKNHVGLFKIGLELFISQGPPIIEAVKNAGEAGVFLDLKLHDIPATVQRALLAASRHGPEFVTIHCDEGGDALRHVVENFPGGTRILAVTVLTSLSRENLVQLGYRKEYAADMTRLVLLKAKIAKNAGCHGIVCSGHEVAAVRKELGEDLVIVTPGIRPEWSLVEQDDQKRVVTPRMAVENGADYVVIGRPIRDARDPAEAAKQVADEISRACPIVRN